MGLSDLSFEDRMKFVDQRLRIEREAITDARLRLPGRHERPSTQPFKEPQASWRGTHPGWLVEALQHEQEELCHPPPPPMPASINPVSLEPASIDGRWPTSAAGPSTSSTWLCTCGNLVAEERTFCRRCLARKDQGADHQDLVEPPPKEHIQEKMVVALALARVKKRQRKVRLEREAAAAHAATEATRKAEVDAIVAQVKAVLSPKSQKLALNAILQGGPTALEDYLVENPDSVRRIQEEMKDRSLLSPSQQNDLTVPNREPPAPDAQGTRECPNGCGEWVSCHPSLQEAHELACPMAIVECQYEGCSWRGRRVDLGEHEWNETDKHLELERQLVARRGNGYSEALRCLDESPPWPDE